MLESFTASNRRLTLTLLAVGAALVAAGAIIGFGDNLPGLVLVYLGSVAGVIGLVHPWRTPRKYRYLAYASVVALGLLVLLQFVLAALARHRTGGLAAHAAKPISVAALLVAVFLCPAGFTVGLFGALVASVRGRRRPPASGAD